VKRARIAVLCIPFPPQRVLRSISLKGEILET
jgi:hypothetical protein